MRRTHNDNYTPGGQTALHDAIARARTDTADHLATFPVSERPENVIVVVLTDGKENASETPQETVSDLVETHREDQDWEFLFIGANQDAALTADQMGMDRSKSLNMSHSSEGTSEAYRSVSDSVSRARTEGKTGGFTDEDRRRQDDADSS